MEQQQNKESLSRNIASTVLPILARFIGIFSTVAGVIGSIWLLCLGKWFILIYALLYILFSKWLLIYALIPGLFLAKMGIRFLETKKIVLGILFSVLHSFYTDLVMALSCTFVFWKLGCEITEQGIIIIPTVLLSFCVAPCPWAALAESVMDIISFLVLQLGCFLLSITLLFFHLHFSQGVFILFIPLIVSSIFAQFMTIQALKRD